MNTGAAPMVLTGPAGRTKIVCTIGPASRSVDILTGLIGAGMDVVRLNFSHGTDDDHETMLQNVREAAGRTGVHLAVLQDLQGPKIRIGEFASPFVDLQAGNEFTITTRPVTGDATRVGTSYTALPADVAPGERILLDDGKIRLEVVRVTAEDVVCRVTVGGRLSAHKGINLPGTTVSAPSLTAKDLRDLDFGIRHDVDYVALSFVRTAEDVRSLRAAIVSRIPEGRYLPVIAKVEKPQAIDNIDAIIAEADGIMVARGDLGVELPPEDVPMLQKRIIRKCNEAGKPVIVATQMLESMIASPSPTRAEASDVANAVVDGADAVMLSGETSVGKYPLETVQIMRRIVGKMESALPGGARILGAVRARVENRLDALGEAACVLAEQMQAAAIVIVTRSGQTARVVSRYRPGPPIIAVTDRPRILRRMALLWGVRGLLFAEGELNRESDLALEAVQSRLVAAGLVRRGEYVVILAGQPFLAQGSTNIIKVERVA